MSEILTRMVQRARGELATVEPLATVPPLLSAAPTPLPETIMERLPEQGISSVPIAAISEGLSAKSAAHNTAHLHETSMANAGVGNLNIDRIMSQPASARIVKTATDAPISGRSTPEMPAVQAAIPASDLNQRGTGEPGAINPIDNFDASSSQQEKPETAVAQMSKATPAHARQPQRQEYLPQVNKSPADPDTALVHETHDHTEVHITIGSVELRLAPANTKAPVFRPRVTLDDFLNRKRGAGA